MTNGYKIAVFLYTRIILLLLDTIIMIRVIDKEVMRNDINNRVDVTYLN